MLAMFGPRTLICRRPMVEHAPGQVVAHIRSSLPSLLPAEQAVPAVFLAHTQKIVEFSSQQVAELAGASRATVVRTCQSLKYSGYQYLRVLPAWWPTWPRGSVPWAVPQSHPRT